MTDEQPLDSQSFQSFHPGEKTMTDENSQNQVIQALQSAEMLQEIKEIQKQATNGTKYLAALLILSLVAFIVNLAFSAVVMAAMP